MTPEGRFIEPLIFAKAGLGLPPEREKNIIDVEEGGGKEINLNEK